MSFLDLVKKRKSVRAFSSKPVPREVLDRCFEAARFSPSACNSQPWSFIIVENKELIDKFVQKAFSGIYSMNEFVKTAPVLVVVITEQSNYIARLGGFLRGVKYSLIDIGIACEHFVLQAREEGLGTCWLGWFNEKGVKKILGLGRDKNIDVIISAGYPEEEVVEAKSRKSLDEIRKYEEQGKLKVKKQLTC